MKDLPGFNYDARRKTLVLNGYVRGSRTVRRQRTIRNVTRDQALARWPEFRSDLETGRAIEGPLTLHQFVDRFYELIAANHRPNTRATQQVLIDNHILRYFGDAHTHAISSIRVVDFMADMRQKKLSSAYINNAVRVLKVLLRQAVERDVLAEYPIKKKVPKRRKNRFALNSHGTSGCATLPSNSWFHGSSGDGQPVACWRLSGGTESGQITSGSLRWVAPS
jgi:Phage integrase, N-terminal SAM-like domain